MISVISQADPGAVLQKTPRPEAADTAGAWFVCHTRPRCEKKFAALMGAERFEHFLPLVLCVRRYGTHTKRYKKPLFPGYVFARIDLERKARIYQQELIARAIPVTDEQVFLRQLDEVRAITSSGYELMVLPLLTKGRYVKVQGGPLHGLEGIVDDATNPKGVIVSVDVLRQGVLVRVPAEQLSVLT